VIKPDPYAILQYAPTNEKKERNISKCKKCQCFTTNLRFCNYCIRGETRRMLDRFDITDEECAIGLVSLRARYL
jgi:hypothetical protein